VSQNEGVLLILPLGVKAVGKLQFMANHVVAISDNNLAQLR